MTDLLLAIAAIGIVLHWYEHSPSVATIKSMFAMMRKRRKQRRRMRGKK